MVGLDLLLARLNDWQEHSASEREGTSFAAAIPAVAGLAARWRRLQLAGWARVIDAALDAERERAAEHWHHLFALVSGASASKISLVLPVVEEFLQSSSIVQFTPRLELLTMLRDHCLLAGRDASTQEQARTHRRLGVSLGNVVAYYAQHSETVQKELKQALAPVRKELAVRLCCMWCLSCKAVTSGA